ncbi:larval cuticle protein A3A-like [Pieris rapae]|uniref:larval cuticle protein A3A-like n=1 Tax=Pieris rapae TaxID=64459 RepID=UPI001E279DAA|nr:larval cuticle protein A3A-like [Pieris rapae]
MSLSTYYFTANSYNMIRIVLCLCVLRVAAIIVTDAPPSTEYNYWYNIGDPTTGAVKFHKKISLGNFRRGSYYLIDPDGSKRTVDSKNDFKAIIRTVPYNSHKSYSPFNYAYRVPLPEFHQPPTTSTNSIQDEPVLFTPGNNTQIDRPTFSQRQLFMPNYMHH